MTIWTVLVLFCVVRGAALCLWLFRSHLDEDRERRRIQIHDWAMQQDREQLLAAGVAAGRHLDQDRTCAFAQRDARAFEGG